MRPALSALILMTPVLLVACEAGEVRDAAAPDTARETQADPSAVEAEVAAIRESWVEGARAGDAAAVASLYADDAVVVGVDGEVLEGREAIREGFAPDFEAMTSLEVNGTDMEVGSDVVTDMGTFTQAVRTPDGQEQTVSGHYLVVLRRQADGSWRLTQHLSAAPQSPQASQGEGEGM